MSSNLTLTDYWNLESIKTIAFLQTKFFDYEWWLVQASVYGDNREAFSFFFPIVAGLLNVLGARVLWAAILVEWVNLILKWVCKGDRPYWWIAESDVFTSVPRPLLRQFPNTCESGPGTPSGHVMMNVAIFYVVARGLLRHFVWNSKKPFLLKFGASSVLLATYVAWIAIVFISRLYIQAHFIHQCVLSVFIGLVVGHFVWKNKWLVRSHRFGSIVFANVIIGSSLLTYVLMLNYGLDPLWAIPLAMKHCINPDYVRVDTQPYYLMARITASALGLGFGIASKKRMIESKAPKSIIRTFLKIKAGLLMGRLCTLLQTLIPTDDLVVYLSLSFLLNMLLPYIVIAIVPYFILSLYHPK